MTVFQGSKDSHLYRSISGDQGIKSVVNITMKAIENKKNLRGQKFEELAKALSSEYENLALQRINVASRKEKNFNKINGSRKQIARIKTLMNEKLKEAND